MVSGLPLKSQESIFHNSQRERIEPMEYTSILYCFGVPGPVDMVSGGAGRWAGGEYLDRTHCSRVVRNQKGRW